MILIYELFPHCNLNCDFCFQRCENKKAEYNNDYQYSKIDYIKQAKQSFLDNLKDKDIDLLCLWGGELFYDVSKEYYDTFMDFLNTINPKKIFYYTNLMVINGILNDFIFNENFSNKCQEQISYDPIGRFKTAEQEKRFFDNLAIIRKADKFKNNKINITTILQPEVITKQCDLTKLKELMNDKNINLIFKEYERPYPEEIRNNYNKIILDFYKEFNGCDNVYHLREVNNSREDSITLNHYCPCFSNDTRFFTYANNFTYNEKATCDTYLNGKEQLQEFLKNYDCDNCPYRERCVDMCPSRMVNSGLKNCYRKYLYEHLQELSNENDTI